MNFSKIQIDRLVFEGSLRRGDNSLYATEKDGQAICTIEKFVGTPIPGFKFFFPLVSLSSNGGLGRVWQMGTQSSAAWMGAREL